jgi:hypothetical protein
MTVAETAVTSIYSFIHDSSISIGSCKNAMGSKWEERLFREEIIACEPFLFKIGVDHKQIIYFKPCCCW